MREEDEEHHEGERRGIGQVMIEKLGRIPANLAIWLVKFYRAAISPLFPACCRYVPSCSEYSLIALKRFGFRKGISLSVRRIIRCRPGGPYGFDPVPEE